MREQPDGLLVELFESVYRELSIALEAQHRLGEAGDAEQPGVSDALARKIAKLKVALSGLQLALEQPKCGIVH